MKKIISLLLTIFILSAIAGMTVSADAIDHYLVGDADGDGIISVLDATKVQRLLADYVVDEDGMIALRGDVNGDGVSILDATFIQRYLADFDLTVPFNENAADVDGDDDISILDAAFIQRFLHF